MRCAMGGGLGLNLGCWHRASRPHGPLCPSRRGPQPVHLQGWPLLGGVGQRQCQPAAAAARALARPARRHRRLRLLPAQPQLLLLQRSVRRGLQPASVRPAPLCPSRSAPAPPAWCAGVLSAEGAGSWVLCRPQVNHASPTACSATLCLSFPPLESSICTGLKIKADAFWGENVLWRCAAAGSWTSTALWCP